jgi:hypothetical protein
MTPQSMQKQAPWGTPFPPAPESALPVPYTGGQQPAPYNMASGFPTPTIHQGGAGGALVPARPGGDGPIYIPPMYTKPRAIIPRYRIISGLISFIVVIGLLCAGGIYYAKATGKLSFLRQLYDPHVQNIKPSPTVHLPFPTVFADYGPAAKIINSATTASSIDPGTAQPRNPTNVFQIGDPIYVTYSVHTTVKGTVILKWFTGQTDAQQIRYLEYFDSAPIPIYASKNGVSGYTQESYAAATEGRVDIYWNTQLAIRLYFVVEPNPQ